MKNKIPFHTKITIVCLYVYKKEFYDACFTIYDSLFVISSTCYPFYSDMKNYENCFINFKIACTEDE